MVIRDEKLAEPRSSSTMNLSGEFIQGFIGASARVDVDGLLGVGQLRHRSSGQDEIRAEL
jgi:hypothetical protein